MRPVVVCGGSSWSRTSSGFSRAEKRKCSLLRESKSSDSPLGRAPALPGVPARVPRVRLQKPGLCFDVCIRYINNLSWPEF